MSNQLSGRGGGQATLNAPVLGSAPKKLGRVSVFAVILALPAFLSRLVAIVLPRMGPWIFSGRARTPNWIGGRDDEVRMTR